MGTKNLRSQRSLFLERDNESPPTSGFHFRMDGRGAFVAFLRNEHLEGQELVNLLTSCSHVTVKDL